MTNPEQILKAWMAEDFEGIVPESWCCVDCGMDTAPGCLNRAQMEKVVKALGEKWHTRQSIHQSNN